MGKILSLREAINLIWETVEIGREMESGCPYLFIVGAGISAPEILTANGIIDQCKKKVEQLCQGDEEKLQRICDTAERLGENSAKYYSDIVNIGLHFFLKNVRPYAASCSEA